MNDADGPHLCTMYMECTCWGPASADRVDAHILAENSNVDIKCTSLVRDSYI